MNSINHIRLGVERIFFIISLVLVFGFTVIIANHYKVDLFIGKPLMYLLYYIIAMLAPLLISQILLWVIYGFKGIPFRLMLTRKILAFVFAFIASLCVIYLLLIGIIPFMVFDHALIFILYEYFFIFLLFACLIGLSAGVIVYIHTVKNVSHPFQYPHPIFRLMTFLALYLVIMNALAIGIGNQINLNIMVILAGTIAGYVGYWGYGFLQQYTATRSRKLRITQSTIISLVILALLALLNVLLPNRLNMFGLFLLFFIELAIAITLGRLTYQKNNHQKDGSTMRINHD
ncbi:TPA: hypothetical protein SMN36_000711 [Proteus mirabilis]|nr:hypothetical protein [Proteus mirabilis]